MKTDWGAIGAYKDATMFERIDAAIASAIDDGKSARAISLAVISVMREPTERMIVEGMQEDSDIDQETVKLIWRSMVNEIVAEIEG